MPDARHRSPAKVPVPPRTNQTGSPSTSSWRHGAPPFCTLLFLLLILRCHWRSIIACRKHPNLHRHSICCIHGDVNRVIQKLANLRANTFACCGRILRFSQETSIQYQRNGPWWRNVRGALATKMIFGPRVVVWSRGSRWHQMRVLLFYGGR